MNDLIEHIDRLHTTTMGAERIRNNLSLDVDDVVQWCKEAILNACAKFERKGKNWYVKTVGCEITVNARSYTIITAHLQGNIG